MDFVSLGFYVFLAATLVVYYLLPLRFRWYALLVASLSYFCIATQSPRSIIVFAGIILVSYALGLLIERVSRSEERGIVLKRCVLAASIAAVVLPLFISKFQPVLYAIESLLDRGHSGIVVSMGLSFFTLQIVAYLADVYKGKIDAQRNLLKYALFVSFFPQILQGPIPRYEQLEDQLVQGHRFDAKGFAMGFMLILWGFFLKLMIADKAGVVVDAIFADPQAYQGAYVLVGGVLYSIQLYTDFLACVTLAQGVSELFGIHLVDNFDHPYFSTSIKDFWRRWHLSLSFWLRDYIYIPLGGNRKGKLRKYLNVIITFFVSGLWHGTGVKYVFWGLMHGFYQIIGDLTQNLRDRFFGLLGLSQDGRARKWIRRASTFTLVAAAWVIFRADSLGDGLFMLQSLVTTWNPWVLFDDSLLLLGLDWKDWFVLTLSVLVLIWVSTKQEEGLQLRERIMAQPFWLRCLLYAAVIVCIMVFGTYGYGFDAADFIYGGF